MIDCAGGGNGWGRGRSRDGRRGPQNAHLHRSIALETVYQRSTFPWSGCVCRRKLATAIARSCRLREFSEEIADFADTAALIACCDLVVSVDTAVAHLAGAMAKQVWILLSYVPDCRWMIDREDSRWYPTARLFRQTRAGDWDEVFTRVAAELAGLATDSPAGAVQQQLAHPWQAPRDDFASSSEQIGGAVIMPGITLQSVAQVPREVPSCSSVSRNEWLLDPEITFLNHGSYAPFSRFIGSRWP